MTSHLRRPKSMHIYDGKTTPMHTSSLHIHLCCPAENQGGSIPGHHYWYVPVASRSCVSLCGRCLSFSICIIAICWLIFVNLIWTGGTWEETTSSEELPPSYWLVNVCLVDIFLSNHWCRRSLPNIGSAAPGQVGLSCTREKNSRASHGEQATQQCPPWSLL